MGFRMKITGGAEPITFDERSILKVDFDSASAKDSNARATDYGLSVRVWGKMLYKLGGEGDDATLGLAQWSQVPSEKADCYRNAEITVAGMVIPPAALLLLRIVFTILGFFFLSRRIGELLFLCL